MRNQRLLAATAFARGLKASNMDLNTTEQKDKLEYPVYEPEESSVRPAMQESYNVLFLCTENSARSIFAEVILNHRGASKFHAFSAGSSPKGTVHPNTIKQLITAGLPTDGLRSKSWDEFAKPSAPEMDFIFTVCDDAAKEVCPNWPGKPITGHWSVPDPAAAQGAPEEIDRAFRDAFFILERHIALFQSLPHASIDALTLKAKMAAVGHN